MRRVVLNFLMLLAGFYAGTVVRADTPPTTVWKFETVHLKNGTSLYGLVTAESSNLIRFQNVRRAAGRPTVIIHTSFKRGEIAKIDRLSADDHKKLEELIQELEQATP